MNPLFRKTLLAVAVAGAALSTQAQTIKLDNNGLVFESGYAELWTLNGSYSGNLALTDSDPISAVYGLDTSFGGLGVNANIDVRGNGAGAFSLWDSVIATNLSFDGTLNAQGDIYNEGEDRWGPFGIALIGEKTLENINFTLQEKYSSIVHANIINRASIAVNGPAAAGILISGTLVGGSLVNEGRITVTGNGDERTYGDGSSYYTETLGVVGIGIDSTAFEKTTSRGTEYKNFDNKGFVQAESENAKGLDFRDVRLGFIINGGTITASGRSIDGVSVVNSEISSFDEISTTAIYLEDSHFRQIINNGNIVAAGAGSVGLALSERTTVFAVDDAHIVNNGRIEGGETAISIDAAGIGFTNSTQGLVISNQGDIISQSGRAAIKADYSGYMGTTPTPINLLWKQGTISGDLLGLAKIDVLGDVTFNRQQGNESALIQMAQGGQLSVGSATQAGHLRLGQPHTRIEGNLDVHAGSILSMNLSTATSQSEPLLVVTGTAEFSDGSQIKLAAKGSDFTAEGSQYTLVEAGSLVDNGLKVASSSILLTVDTYKSEGNQIIATVTGKGEAEILDAIGNEADKGAVNAAKAASAFNHVLASLPAGDPVRLALTGGSEAEQARNARQLAPEISGGASQAATFGQAMIRNVAAGRTGGARGLSSGGAFAQTGVWVQALNSDATQDLRDGVAGFDASTTGIAVGLDGKLNEQLTLGLAYSFLDTDVDAEGGNKTEVQGHNFTLYSGFVQNGFFVDGSLTYGQNANEGKRLIATTLAKADYDSNLLGVNLTAGYTYPLQGTVVVEPQVTARYSNVEIDAIQESGSSAALNTDAQRYEVGELGAGVQLVGRIDLEQGSISPRIKLMAYHDLIADQAQSTSSFVLGGTPFVTTGAKPERNSYEAGLGADYRLGALTLGVSYDYFGKSDYSSDTFSAKVRYDF